MAVLAVATLTACHNDRPAPPASTATSTVGPSPAGLPTQGALDAYRGMWDSIVSAAKTADPDAPDLRHYATGDALSRIVGALYLQHEQGQVTLGTLTLAPTVDTGQSTAADIQLNDCVDASLWLVYRDSGGLVDNTPGGTHATVATVTNTDGRWMVSTLDIAGVGSC
jgi:hypothetical protein